MRSFKIFYSSFPMSMCVPMSLSHGATHALIQKVLSVQVQLNVYPFLLMRGERVQIPLKVGHHQPPSETPFHWRAKNGPSFCDFSGDPDQKV